MRKDRIIQNTFLAQLTACILSALAGTIGSMVDGVIIGQYLGSDSIAAFGVVNPLLTVFSVFGAIVATGSRTRFTKLVGAGKVKDAQSIFSLACVLSVGLATVVMAVILPFASPFAVLLGASGNAASLLPPSFDVPEEDQMEGSITSKDEMISMSRAVRDFAKPAAMTRGAPICCPCALKKWPAILLSTASPATAGST